MAAYLVIGLLPRLRFLGAFASPVLLAIGVFALMPALDPPHGGATGIFRRAGQPARGDHFAGLRRVRTGRGGGGHVPDAAA